MVSGECKGSGFYPIYAFEHGYQPTTLNKKDWSQSLGIQERGIAELEPNNANDINKLQINGSNYNNEDDETKKLHMLPKRKLGLEGKIND